MVTRGRESSFELLRLASEHDGGTYVLHVTGELDLLSSGALRYELDRALASGADRIVLDLSGLTFIDASGLRVIEVSNRQAGDHPGRFLIRRGPPNVQRVFVLTSAAERLQFET